MVRKNFFASFWQWKFSNYSLEHSKDVTDYLSFPNFEEFADTSLPVYTQADVCFYWFSNWSCFFNLKLFFKIKKSIKLRDPYFKMLFENKKENFELKNNFVLLMWKKKLIKFLNYWGRIKRFFYVNWYVYFYFYKYYHYKKFYLFFWWWKFSDFVLKTEFLHGYFLFSSNSFFFIPLYETNFFAVRIKFLDEFERQKAVWLWSRKSSIWSYPHSRIKKHLKWYFSSAFGDWQTLVSKKNFFFFNDLFFIIKSFSHTLVFKENLMECLFFFFYWLDDWNLSILQWNYLFLIVLLVFSFLSQNMIDNTNLFLIFFSLLWFFFFWFLKGSIENIFIGEIFYFRFVKLFSMREVLDITPVERFLNSYIFNYRLKLNWFGFFQGYSKTLVKEFYFYPLELPVFTSFNFLTQYLEFYWFKRRKFDWIDIAIKKNLLILPLKFFLFSWSKLFSLFMWERRDIITKESDEITVWRWKRTPVGYFFSQFWSNLHFFSTTIDSLGQKNCMKQFWILNLLPNLAIMFNKNLHLDTFSSFAISYFFSNCSTYNYRFFIWLNFETIYPMLEEFFLLPLGLEFVFFTKSFIYKSDYDLFNNLVSSFSLYILIANSTRISQSKKFFMRLHPDWWFESADFMEELFHLSITYLSEDIERAQEFVWTKQLSEIWLEKLTDYLKEMWLQKIEVGNVQYSPDFTQDHEFGLVLKWGLELETLKKTWIIILKWFHGTRKKSFKGNIISKKIDFLYKFWKFMITSYVDTREALMNSLYLSRSDVNLLRTKTVQWRLDLLTKWNFVEMTRLSLATIVAVNWTCYKYSYDQFDTMLLNFPIFAERTIKEIYDFVLAGFDWLFFIDTYNRYYSQKIVKRRIWFFKMIRKKVYLKFMETQNFFNVLSELKNSFNYDLFSKFRWLRYWVNKVVKNKFFFIMLFSVIFKHYRSFFMPSWDSWNDYQLYIYQWNNIFPSFGIKFLLFSNQIDFTRWVQHLFRPEELFNLMLQDSIDLEKYYKFLSLPTLLLNINFKNFYYFLCFNLPGINFNNLLSQVDVESIFQNFFSEFFYDLYANFFKDLQERMFLSSNRQNIWLNNFNVYQNLVKNSFSVSFFHYFNSKLFTKTKYFWQHFLYYLNNFFFFSLRKSIVKDFCYWFKQFFFFTAKLKISLNLRHLLFMDLLVRVTKNFFFDKKFWWQIILSFFLWLQKLSSLENIDVILRSVFFNYSCLNAHIYHIEIFFINFLIKLIDEFFWK